VIVNLVVNAAEAVEAPGWIELELREAKRDELAPQRPADDGAWLRLRVRDDGAGMDAETVARAFEPYFTTKLTGRGLGLSAVQGIVQSHGGFVRLQSEVGRGTTVDVFLPEAPPPASERGRTPPSRRPRGRPPVLIADDEAPLRLMLRAMLEELDYEVLEAEDGIRCLEVLRERPDTSAVILDATMPRMGGAEVLRVMHEEQIDVPVVLCSGFPSDIAVRDRVAGDRTEQDQERPFRFLAKPFSLDELERTLEVMIAG